MLGKAGLGGLSKPLQVTLTAAELELLMGFEGALPPLTGGKARINGDDSQGKHSPGRIRNK